MQVWLWREGEGKCMVSLGRSFFPNEAKLWIGKVQVKSNGTFGVGAVSLRRNWFVFKVVWSGVLLLLYYTVVL